MLDAEIACYSLPGPDTIDIGEDGAPGDGTPDDPQITDVFIPTDMESVVPGVAPFTLGAFNQHRCGLIPERHDNTRQIGGTMKGGLLIVDPAAETPGNFAVDGTGNNRVFPHNGSATPRAHAVARYDAGDESMVYVWLANGMDMDNTKPSKQRMLDVAVKCEDGEVMMDEDVDGTPKPINVPAPDMITMIDPNGDDLADYTDMCSGDRGVLQITMPDGSAAGMVFTHITQMMGHYRMNFPGYSMANPATCWSLTAAAGIRDIGGTQRATVDVNGDGSVGGVVNADGTGFVADDTAGTSEAASNEDITAARVMACM